MIFWTQNYTSFIRFEIYFENENNSVQFKKNFFDILSNNETDIERTLKTFHTIFE